MKDYILDHNFGNYESENNIKKLKIKNKEDLCKYLLNALPNVLNARVDDDFIIKFNDGSVYALLLESK